MQHGTFLSICENFRERLKDAALYGLVHAFANALNYFQVAASFYVGCVLINKKYLSAPAVFRSVFNSSIKLTYFKYRDRF